MPTNEPLHHDDAPIAPRNPRTALIAYAATNLDAPPRYNATNVVHCRGKRLSGIIWRGQQWAVTAYGIECRDGTYSIAKERLWENEEAYGWIMHMRSKGWVDVVDFAEALRIARHRHAPTTPKMTGTPGGTPSNDFANGTQTGRVLRR